MHRSLEVTVHCYGCEHCAYVTGLVDKQVCCCRCEPSASLSFLTVSSYTMSHSYVGKHPTYSFLYDYLAISFSNISVRLAEDAVGVQLFKTGK